MDPDHLGPAARIVADLGAGRSTAIEIASATLAAIESAADLAAFVHVDPDLVLAEARERDGRHEHGPLHGVPIGVKDIIDTGDQPTAYGSRLYAGHRPARDATAVARLRAAGAVIVGKTATTEFALFAPAATVNPLDATRTPGGSSSGSAAAVAAGLVPLALGTQTAGSVVRPASFCGLFGAKPTFGAVPVDGVKACAVDLDTVGVLGRDVGDLALALAVMADDPAPFAVRASEGRLRVGWLPTPEWALVPDATRRAIAAGLARLEAAEGIDVVARDAPPAFEGLVAAQSALMRAQAHDALPEALAERDAISDELRAYLDGGPDPDAIADGRAHRERALGELPALFDGVDVVLAPAVLGEAPDRATTGDPVLCRAWTLLGTPTVAVPGLTGPSGLPLGIQVVAPHGADGLALSAAGRIARALVA
jgi:Asp-tRNA(Asn)/Glu-tRNA(Gln) amidotransferase A subunit family amidase